MMHNEEQAWLLTGGLHGMFSQAAGLANALGLTFAHHAVRLKKPWSYLPSQLVPTKPFVFGSKLPENPPKVVISCGRHAAIASKFIKIKYPEVFNIHIQNPIIDRSAFDCVIAPLHDGLKDVALMTTMGAIHNLNHQTLKNSQFDKSIKQLSSPPIALVLGGPTKSFPWQTESMLEAIKTLIKAADDNGYQLICVPSNRTPANLLDALRIIAPAPHVVISEICHKAYHAALNAASHIVVSCDSASMLSEAAFTGKPVYCLSFPPRRSSERLAKLHQSLYDKGIVRPWQGRLENWSYPVLDEASRIAGLLREKYTNVFL